MKEVLQEIVYVFKTLDKSTIRKLLVMVVATLTLCTVFVRTMDNPVFERWAEERETKQLIEERKEGRKNKTEDVDITDEDIGEEPSNESSNSNKDPVF